MSDDEPDDLPPCKSCGVPWGDHLGIQGTCAKLVWITEQIKRLRLLSRTGVIKKVRLIEILDAILGDDS